MNRVMQLLGEIIFSGALSCAVGCNEYLGNREYNGLRVPDRMLNGSD